MQPWAESFYKSKRWQECRNAFARSRSGLCEECRKKGLIVPGGAVHHKIPLTRENITNPEISLSWDNLELLCRDCHAARHKKEKRYKVDELGRVQVKV